jgi:hypothetical protein
MYNENWSCAKDSGKLELHTWKFQFGIISLNADTNAGGNADGNAGGNTAPVPRMDAGSWKPE